MNRAAPVFSVGTRAAGAVVVAGYLTGLTPGPVVAVVGGLALITFGRVILLDRLTGAASAAALAVIAGALGIAALRWGTLEIEGLVGAQTVLGPTVVVAPEAAAIASSVALGAGVIALGVWLAAPVPSSRGAWAWSVLEGGLVALTVMIVFAVPAAGGGTGLGGAFGALGRDPGVWALWVGAVIAAIAVAAAGSLALRSRAKLRWGVLGLSAAGVVAAAGTIASVL